MSADRHGKFFSPVRRFTEAAGFTTMGPESQKPGGWVIPILGITGDREEIGVIYRVGLGYQIVDATVVRSARRIEGRKLLRI